MIHQLQLQDKTYTLYNVNSGCNQTQTFFFNNMFNDDLSVKQNGIEEFAYFGGFRCGKSWSVQTAIYLISVLNPCCRILFVRATYDQLKDTVIQQFNDDYKQNGYVYYSTSREAKFANGSVLKFRAFDKDTNILSSEYDVIACCQAEDLPFELYLQLKGRLSGNILGKPILITEGNPASGWVKDRYKTDITEHELPQKNELLKKIMKKLYLENRGYYNDKKKLLFIEGQTRENEHNLRPGYIESLRRDYPDFWFRRYVLSEWSSIDELVFSEFDWAKHVIESIDNEYLKDRKIRLGFDYGWRTNSAIVWGCLDWEENLVIFDDWAEPAKTPDEISTVSRKYGRHMMVSDYSIKRPDRDGRSLWDDLEKEGLWLEPANKDELQNIVLINRLFRQGRIKITRNCVNLLKELQSYKWEKQKLGSNKEASEKPVQKDNHNIDALCYLIASLEELKIESPADKAFKGTIAWHTHRTEANIWDRG